MTKTDLKLQHRIHRLKQRYAALTQEIKRARERGYLSFFANAHATMTAAWCLHQLGALDGVSGPWTGEGIEWPPIDVDDLRVAWEDYPPSDIARIANGEVIETCYCLTCALRRTA